MSMLGFLPLSTRSRVVISSCLFQALVLGGVFSYGVFIPILEAELGWSRTLLSASSSLAFLIMGVLAIAMGRLNDTFGPRWVLSITGAVCGLGFALMSFMQAPWQLMVFFGLFVGIGLSGHDVVTLSTIAMWFDRRRGVMSGVVKTGTACGQMIMPLVATALFVALGWRQALLIMGVFIGFGLVLVAQWMKKPAHDSGAAAGRGSAYKSGASYSEARRSKSLWIMCAIQFCFFPALMTIPLHIVAHAKDLGMSTPVAATVLSTLGGSSIAGRLAVGLLFDKIGGKLTLQACLSMLLFALVSLLLIDSGHWLYLCAFVYGAAHGGLFTVVSPTVAEYFGMRAHGAIFGTILFFGTLGGAVGPILAGVIYDTNGSYQLAFQILIVLAGCGLILTSMLTPLTSSKTDAATS